MTLDEANKELCRISDPLYKPDWFCPLINGTCVPDCICYYKPGLANRYVSRERIAKLSKAEIDNIAKKYPGFTSSWYIYGNRCDNAMFRVGDEDLHMEEVK